MVIATANGMGPLVFWLAIVVTLVWVFYSVFRKAGYSGWQALLLFLPGLNFVWLIVFASTTWPIEREMGIARLGLRRASTQDEELALNTAVRYERRGLAVRAAGIYALIIENAANAELVSYARSSLENLKQANAAG